MEACIESTLQIPISGRLPLRPDDSGELGSPSAPAIEQGKADGRTVGAEGPIERPCVPHGEVAGKEPLEVECQAEQSAQAANTGKSGWSAWVWLGLRRESAQTLPNIVHVRIDSLFASVEQVLNPRLRGKAVAVGRETVVSASDEAKMCGVTAGMLIAEARQICPSVLVVRGRYPEYAAFAERVRSILEAHASSVLVGTSDDFFLELSPAQQTEQELRGKLVHMQMELFKTAGLSVSIAAARTRVLAAIASAQVQPRGLRIVNAEEETRFLAPLPLDMLPGVRPEQAERLEALGIKTVAELSRVPKPALTAVLGEPAGRMIWAAARGGLDADEADGGTHRRGRPRSWFEREIFRGGRMKWSKLQAEAEHVVRAANVASSAQVSTRLKTVIEYLGERAALAVQGRGKLACTVGLSLRFADDLTVSETVCLGPGTDDPMQIIATANDLLSRRNAGQIPAEQVCLTLSDLVERQPIERNVWETAFAAKTSDRLAKCYA